MHILVPIAQRDSTVFESQRLSGFKKIEIAFSNFVKRQTSLPLLSLIGLVVLRRPKVTFRKTQILPGKVGTKWFHMEPKSVMVPESLRVPGSLR